MKIIRKICILPLLFVVFIASLCVKLLIKAETHIGGIFILILGICVVLALLNKMWLQLGIFMMMVLVVFMGLFISVVLDIWLDDLLETLKRA